MNNPTPTSVFRLNVLQVAAAITAGKCNASENITVADKLLAWIEQGEGETPNAVNMGAAGILSTVGDGPIPLGGSAESRAKKSKAKVEASVPVAEAQPVTEDPKTLSTWQQVRDITLRVRDEVNEDKLVDILKQFVPNTLKITDMVGKQHQPYIDACTAALDEVPAPVAKSPMDFGV